MYRSGLVAFLILLFLTAPVSAQSLNLSIDSPSSAEAGSSVSLSVSIGVPDIGPRSHQADLKIGLKVDGDLKRSKTVSVKDGETATAEFSHTFQSSGTRQVTIEASTSIAGQPFSASKTTEIDVEKPPVKNKTISLTGASLPLPRSLEDEAQRYRAGINVAGVPDTATVVAREETLYLVFSQNRLDKGIAEVKGRELPGKISWRDLTFTPVLAEKATVTKEGKEATVKTVKNNPSRYRLNLVEFETDYRRAALLIDPDKGQNFDLSVTSGVIGDLGPADLAKNLSGKARTLVKGSSTGNLRNVLETGENQGINSFSFETEYWLNSPASVDGIVLNPKGAAMNYVEKVVEKGRQGDRWSSIIEKGGDAVIYRVQTRLQPQTVSGIQDIKDNLDKYEGKVVSLKANAAGTTVSVQETVEHSTPCGEDRAKIGNGCVNIPVDILIDTAVAWNGVPRKGEVRESTLLSIGASSRHQDQPAQPYRGQYRLVGKVISTTRINSSLPEAAALLIYRRERLADTDWEEIAKTVKQRIENRRNNLVENQRTGILGKKIEEAATRKIERAKGVIQDIPAEKPVDIEIEEGPVPRVSIQVKNPVSGVEINVEKLGTRPPSIEKKPPGKPLNYLNVSVEVDEDNVESGSITFTVERSTLQEEGIQPENVVLARYLTRKQTWQPLDTSVASREEAEVKFTAQTPGFSTFAITEKTTEETPTETPTETPAGTPEEAPEETPAGTPTPGFTALLAAISIPTAAYIIRARQN